MASGHEATAGVAGHGAPGAGQGGVPESGGATHTTLAAVVDPPGDGAPAGRGAQPASQLEPGSGSGLPQTAAEDGEGAAVSADGLRCLDASHPADCARLRHLILSCPEWNDPAARQTLAEQMEEEGDTDTARVLRTKDAPSLRKPSMCAIARGWRYKADVFRPKSERVEPVLAPSSRRSKRRRVAPTTYAEGATEEALDAALANHIDMCGGGNMVGLGGPHGMMFMGQHPGLLNMQHQHQMAQRHAFAGMHPLIHHAGLAISHPGAHAGAYANQQHANSLLASMPGLMDLPPLSLAATAGANAAMNLQSYSTAFSLPLWQAAAASIGLHPGTFFAQPAGQAQQPPVGGNDTSLMMHQQATDMARTGAPGGTLPALDVAAAALFSGGHPGQWTQHLGAIGQAQANQRGNGNGSLGSLLDDDLGPHVGQ